MSFVLFPLLVALVLGVVGAPAMGRVGPRVGAWAAVAVAVLLAAVAQPAAWLVLAVGRPHHGRAIGADWRALLHPLPSSLATATGLAISVWAVLGTTRMLRAWVRHRGLRVEAADETVVIDDARAVAYSLPGHRGPVVVVSSGLIAMLDAEELAIVVAHERAHGRHGHHRLLLAAECCRAFLPPLAPIVRRLRFELERWADESAVATTGCDRTVAARTIARVALAGTADRSGHGLAPAMATHGVLGRAEAMMSPAPRPSVWVRALVVLHLAVVAALVATQAHHLASLAHHVPH
ncbi:MAG: M56 family metallopeptidase [Ilumatobacteraceae bacterium]